MQGGPSATVAPLLSLQPLGLKIKPLIPVPIASSDVFPLLPHLTPAADTMGCIFLLTCVKIIPLSPASYEFMLPTFFKHLQQLPCFVGFVWFFFYVKPAFNLAPKDLVVPHVQVLWCKKEINTKLCMPSSFISHHLLPHQPLPQGHFPPLQWP